MAANFDYEYLLRELNREFRNEEYQTQRAALDKEFRRDEYHGRLKAIDWVQEKLEEGSRGQSTTRIPPPPSPTSAVRVPSQAPPPLSDQQKAPRLPKMIESILSDLPFEFTRHDVLQKIQERFSIEIKHIKSSTIRAALKRVENRGFIEVARETADNQPTVYRRIASRISANGSISAPQEPESESAPHLREGITEM